MYKIYFSIKKNFLKVELIGSYPLEKFQEIVKKIDEVIDEYNITKVLTDLRKFEGRFGVFDGLHQVEKFREESKYIQFAVLDKIENKSNNDFFENAAYNRGFKLLFFYDEESAMKWLDLKNNYKFDKIIEYAV